MKVYFQAAACVASLAMISVVNGQTLGAAAPAAQTGAASAQAANEPSGQLEEVIVTAQRRSERLQDVPVAVTAVSAAQIESSGITSTQDLSLITPGLTTPETGGYAQPHIRGVGSTTNGPGLEQPVATYIDGVYIAAAPTALLTLNNVDRIEVLKGPQGTLFGRNATGGLIQVITKDPSSDPAGDFSVGYGNYNDVVASGYLSGPLMDKLNGDIALRYETQQDGWGRDLATDKDVGALARDLTGRVKFLFEPSDATQIRLAADYEDRSSSQDYFKPLFNYPTKPPLFDELFGPFPQGGRYDVNYNATPLVTLQSGGVSLQVKQDLGPVSFQSITAYRDAVSTLLLDLDLTPLKLTTLYGKAGDQQFSQEFQLSSATASNLRWTAGLFYFYALDQWEPINIYVDPPLATPELTLGTNDVEHTNSGAAYGQASYEFSSNTEFTLGGRYTYEHKSLSGVSSTLVGGVDVGDVPIPTPGLGIPTSVESRRFNYRAALDQKFTQDVMGYISANSGFKSGGFNLSVPTNPPYRPEDIRAYEGGLKTELFDRKARLNVAGYYYDYKDIQVGRYIDNNESLYNGAGAHVYGTDLDGQVNVARGLTLSGGLAYNHSRFTSFPDADYIAPVNGMPVPPNGVLSGSATGNVLPYAPQFTVDVAADYKIHLAIGTMTANATYFHTSKFYTAADNVASQSGYGLLNLALGWTDPSGRFFATVWGKNVTNTYYATTINETNNSVGAVLGAPATYGITVGYHLAPRPSQM